MPTIREAAVLQTMDKIKQNGASWDNYEDFVQTVVQEKFGVHSTLLDFEERTEGDLYLVEIDDGEFGKVYLKINDSKYCDIVFDKYRWTKEHRPVANSIELLRNFDY